MMTAREFVKHCRANRDGASPPEGNILEARVLREVLLLILQQRLEDMIENVPQQQTRYDLDNGRTVPIGPAPKPPDPREDETACALAHLIAHVEDLSA